VDPHGADQAAVFVANAILEGAAGVPLALHFDVTGCPSAPRNISRPGRRGGTIEAQLALFLVVQTQQTVFSLSGNWYDAGATSSRFLRTHRGGAAPGTATPAPV
jgi:hypothetical protein